MLAVFALIFGLLAGFSAGYEEPAPKVHDEFAYLLTGDTFAHGRLTNESHPLSAHFETFHVFQHPTYQAKYPPAQGAALALGQWLGGRPIVGVWLSTALAAAASFWMLLAFQERRWALLGSLLFFTNLPLFMEWGQTYWGGSVAALGGALFLGGLARVLTRSSRLGAWAAGAGLFVLANSRPAEGLLVCGSTVLALLLCGTRRESCALARRPLRVLAPALVTCGLLLLAWTALYDFALTGDALRLPYFAYDHLASVHAEIRDYTGSPERSFLGKMRYLQRYFVGDVLVAALPFLLLRRSRLVLGAAGIVAVTALASVLWTRGYPHYVAMLAPLTMLLSVEALRGLAGLRPRGLPLGAAAVLAVVLLHLGLNAETALRLVRAGPQPSWHRQRRELVERLEQDGERHVIIVRYGPGHSVHEEWVFNGADIDGSPVVWARELPPPADAALLEYFGERRAWSLTLPAETPRLVPYER